MSDRVLLKRGGDPGGRRRWSEKIAQLEERSWLEVARIVFRKLIYRKVVMRCYEIVAADSAPPDGPVLLDIRFVDAAEAEWLLASSPYLKPLDLGRFRAQRSLCIIAQDGKRIAASSWMTRGTAYVPELQRTLRRSDDEHLSTRSYVAPEYRGRGLLAQMLHAYAVEIAAPSDRLWCLIHAWNVRSIRAYERAGWSYRGDLGTVTLFGRQIPISDQLSENGRVGSVKAGPQA